MPNQEEIEGGARDTLRGVASILVIGVVLGVAFNALALMGRPPRGIPWKAGPEPVVTLESLQSGGAPAAGTPTPAPSAEGVPQVPDVPGPIELTLPSLKKLWDAKAVLIIDARDAIDYSDGHIAGAINVPYNEVLANPEKGHAIDAGGRPIVVYCSGIDCESSAVLADVLVEMGKRRVLVYRGGYPEWQRAGHPTVTGATPGEQP